MKKLGFALAAATMLTAAPALAADLAPLRQAPVLAAAPLYNWSGLYLGIQGGFAWGSSRHRNSAGDITGNFDISGGLFGGTVGYNFQGASPWVFGIETDLSWVSKEGSTSNIAPFNPAFTSETRERWLWTGRGRLGYAWDRALLYVTGGAAGADVRILSTGAGLTASESQTRWGWTVGGGIEMALAANWTAKLEYLYVDFENKAYFTPAPAGFVDRAGGVRLNDHIVRAGINYRFNWGGPVMASY